MKVAISIPDDLFAEADQVAHRRGLTRSALYARALRRMVADEEGDEITARIDASCGDSDQEDLSAAARALIDTGQWEW